MSDAERQDPIRRVSYDTTWVVEFDRERRRVESALAPWLAGPVEHVGSTAVPGLAAKPIIDMAVCVAEYENGREAVAALARIGWVHAPEPGDEAGRKWSFCFPDRARRSHHLHVYEIGNPIPVSLIAFRDHLRSSPEDAAEYGRIKTALAAEDDTDRPRYRAGKAPFIRGVLDRLR
ncbi:GrpB family protein [Actinoplanes couchii]|uniref:GrpB family protein n=1 Tax=Actinoplanes couchii TaxID=403638 RepID=A0ABQ3XI19_9ACTN|nr:GrpB family protein [Actinoplanes couchii]MDR6317680.1 GrpB-like predicted nucleotidyltransferase (UPF0157 family) [Actinoplanes couchii]GID58065.1 hypothetical protein Aco03nite_064690 [Actinoplanes couchii]